MEVVESPVIGKIILVDPGHGGPDGGAGDSNALEKDIALNISLKIKRISSGTRSISDYDTGKRISI